jgi:hypothetical protein
MIITQQMAQILNICVAGEDVALLTSLYGLPYEEIVQSLKNQGHHSYAAWVVINKGNFIKMTPNYTVGKFRVRTPRADGFVYFDTLEELKTGFILLKQQFLEEEKDRFSVAKETILPNGDCTWDVVANIDTATEVARYKVYNHNTGLHEHFDNPNSAKNYVNELKTQFLNFNQNAEQEVFLEDKSLSGWVVVGTTAI